jgi:hypothetical protein
MRQKKMSVRAKLWGRTFPIELWANSLSHARHEIIKDACKTIELHNNDFKLWGYIFSPKPGLFQDDPAVRLEQARDEIRNFLTVKKAPIRK